MKLLKGREEKEAIKFMNEAIGEAKKATCREWKCGSVVVNKGKIIGRGYNSPPGNMEEQRRCNMDKSKLHSKVSDKTCCMHAEERAISDAKGRNSDKLKGAKIYFIRLSLDNRVQFAGMPFCTKCSKFALDEGLSEFILWHENGICAYETGEYNLLSYEFRG